MKALATKLLSIKTLLIALLMEWREGWSKRRDASELEVTQEHLAAAFFFGYFFFSKRRLARGDIK
jgi:hypothetical protein